MDQRLSVDAIIEKALLEDIGEGDHTSLSTIPRDAIGRAQLLVKQQGILSGIDIARKVFKKVDPAISMTDYLSDGSKIKPGDIAFSILGPSISILKAERLVLNFMQRMSGIATTTSLYVEKLEGLNTRVLDTRKTTPLLRELEKQAVIHGGGQNHRFGLYDMIMIKDNHVDFAGGIEKAIKSANEYLERNRLKLKIEIEVRNLKELEQVLKIGGVHRIMLDNFPVDTLSKAVKLVNGKFETEASGGINLDTIRSYAETGVDFVSVGALTHQIQSLDLSLKAS